MDLENQETGTYDTTQAGSNEPPKGGKRINNTNINYVKHHLNMAINSIDRSVGTMQEMTQRPGEASTQIAGALTRATEAKTMLRAAIATNEDVSSKVKQFLG